jgi:hypothetical protein
VEGLISVLIADLKVLIARVLGNVAVKCNASRILVQILSSHMIAFPGVAFELLTAAPAIIAGPTSVLIFTDNVAAAKVKTLLRLRALREMIAPAGVAFETLIAASAGIAGPTSVLCLKAREGMIGLVAQC